MKLTGKIPATRTKLTVGYKWVNGMALSRVDPYGEAIYDMNPYLHIGIRQPLAVVDLRPLGSERRMRQSCWRRATCR